jgi:hypothetical protein
MKMEHLFIAFCHESAQKRYKLVIFSKKDDNIAILHRRRSNERSISSKMYRQQYVQEDLSK